MLISGQGRGDIGVWREMELQTVSHLCYFDCVKTKVIA